MFCLLYFSPFDFTCNSLRPFFLVNPSMSFQLLFKKNLYGLAIQLAKSQELGEEGMIEIYQQYGDHLYVKGEYDGSIAQYIKTIGHLEPSYIIRKVQPKKLQTRVNF